jgi:hypothetical protein
MQQENENVLTTERDTYREVQTDIWETERKKTRNKILSIAVLFFLSDLLALMMANTATGTTIGASLIFPAIFVGTAFLAYNFPLAGIISATIVFLGVVALTVFVVGAKGMFTGILVKAIVVFFLLSGFNSAKEAEEAKRNLQASR